MFRITSCSRRPSVPFAMETIFKLPERLSTSIDRRVCAHVIRKGAGNGFAGPCSFPIIRLVSMIGPFA